MSNDDKPLTYYDNGLICIDIDLLSYLFELGEADFISIYLLTASALSSLR